MLLTLSEPQSSANWKKNPSETILPLQWSLRRSRKQHPLDSSSVRMQTLGGNCPFYGSLINSQQMDLATRWCGFESPHWVSGFNSFSCVSTIFVKINIDCQLTRIRITMETNSSMCLGGSFLIALIEVERLVTRMSCIIPQAGAWLE